MKILLLLALLAQPTGDISYVYPARVQVVEAANDSIARGSGKANVTDLLLGTRAFNYAFAGCRQVSVTGASQKEMYPARWAAPGRLVILIAPYGSLLAECELRVSLQPFSYVVGKAGVITKAPLPGQK